MSEPAESIDQSRAHETSQDSNLLTAELHGRLEQLADVDLPATQPARYVALRSAAPGCFEPDCDLDQLSGLAHRCQHARGLFGTSLLARRRKERARKDLERLAGSPCDTDDGLERVGEAIRFSRALRTAPAAEQLAQEVRDLWSAWQTAERDHRYFVGKMLDRLTISRLSKSSSREAIATISTAFRSGPTVRQRLLAAIEPQSFRDAAPIWLGTLGEIERLLPTVANTFDVVVIDEASQADLQLGAPALLRARRCVILGDPHQLRHVSFISDSAMEEVFEDEALSHEIGRLNLRRNSIFDIAASTTMVQWLDQHYRSLPHLVEFSLREFYSRKVELITRHPTTETRDCIDVIDPGDTRISTCVMKRLNKLVHEGATSVGVISPLRSVIESLQEDALVALGSERIRSLNLMISTAHGFQGAERDHMIVVPGIDATSPPGRRKFVENPNLFNVMVTRARTRMDVVTHQLVDAATLLGRFLEWSTQPPKPVETAPPTHPTAIALGKALSDAGLNVRYRYPVGQHRVDLVVESERLVFGVMCGVHPDGPAAHTDRHLALSQQGWRLIDLVPSVDSETLARIAIELAGIIRA